MKINVVENARNLECDVLVVNKFEGDNTTSTLANTYAVKEDNYLRDLYVSELNDCNAYNTRSSCMSGKLPVGPICNPSLESIISSIEPKKHKYYYFVESNWRKVEKNEKH